MRITNRDNTAVNWNGARFRAVDVSASDYTSEDPPYPFQVNAPETCTLMVLGYLDKDDEAEKTLVTFVPGWNPGNIYKVYTDVGNTITEFVATY